MDKSECRGFEQKIERAFMDHDPQLVVDTLLDQLETFTWTEAEKQQLREKFNAAESILIGQ